MCLSLLRRWRDAHGLARCPSGWGQGEAWAFPPFGPLLTAALCPWAPCTSLTTRAAAVSAGTISAGSVVCAINTLTLQPVGTLLPSPTEDSAIQQGGLFLNAGELSVSSRLRSGSHASWSGSAIQDTWLPPHVR